MLCQYILYTHLNCSKHQMIRTSHRRYIITSSFTHLTEPCSNTRLRKERRNWLEKQFNKFSPRSRQQKYWLHVEHSTMYTESLYFSERKISLPEPRTNFERVTWGKRVSKRFFLNFLFVFVSIIVWQICWKLIYTLKEGLPWLLAVLSVLSPKSLHSMSSKHWNQMKFFSIILLFAVNFCCAFCQNNSV